MTVLAARTDYVSDTDDPHPHLRRIAEAGFSHVHWGHQSMTDLVYTPVDVERIKGQLNELGLKLLDLHGAVGPTRCWWSPDDAFPPLGVTRRLRVSACRNTAGRRPGRPRCLSFRSQAMCRA